MLSRAKNGEKLRKEELHTPHVLLTKVVAIPVLPQRPVRPIRWTVHIDAFTTGKI